MKKVLATFLAFIIGLSMSAQIQNKLLGFTLGVATWSEVYNKYNDQEQFSVDGDGTISVGNLVFAGQIWDYALFCFFDNKLLSVQFTLEEQMISVGSMDSVWEQFQIRLWNKYSDFSEDSPRSDMVLYSDGKTRIAFIYMDISGGKGLALQYADLDLTDQKAQAVMDEL